MDIIQGLTLPVVLSVAGILLVLVGIARDVQLKGIIIKLSRVGGAAVVVFGVILVGVGVFAYVFPQLRPSQPLPGLMPDLTATTQATEGMVTDTPTLAPTSTPASTATTPPFPSATASTAAASVLTPTNTPSPTPSLEWKTNISDRDPVAQMTTLIAEYPGEIEGDVWVFVVDHGRWYPQSMNPREGAGTPKVDDKWEMRLGFGDPDKGEGELFDVALMSSIV